MMVGVATLAAILVVTCFVLEYLGLRDGFHSDPYWYLGSDWKWHVVRGAVIYVNGSIVFID